MIEFVDVTLKYQTKLVLKGISLTIEDGCFCILIGASGCGKTTLLKLVNRLNTATSGQVLLDGKPVSEMPLSEIPGKIGYVVQEGGLFPHLTAAENIALGLSLSGKPKETFDERIDEMLRMVNLDPKAYRDLYPCQMSGGQRQRVGIARAFAPDPAVILMDEPFSALDPVTRGDLQEEVKALQQQTKKTIIFVTHDMDEAIRLADRICILENGRISQEGTPEEILKHPASEEIRDFVGAEKLWTKPDLVKAEEIMTVNPPAISENASVKETLNRMKELRMDELYTVNDDGKLVGVVRESDLRWKLLRGASIARYMRAVGGVVNASSTLEDILRISTLRAERRFAVVDDTSKLLGFLTKEAIIQTLSKGISASA